jgi:RHS repeat-associated protein
VKKVIERISIRELSLWRIIGEFCLVICLTFQANAGSFPGTARLEVSDPTGALSWNSTANALSVQCWFKISIPSGTNLTDNMTILVNRKSGSESDPHAYLVYFNIFTGNVEFSARGSGLYTNTLIARPYLDRWYHVAVVRSGESFTGYIDGHQVFSSSGSTGNAATTDGMSIGGWGNSKYLYGEVQEVSVYQTALSPDFIAQNMFASQPTNDPTLNLKGYFPLGYSTNAAAELSNFAPAPVPSGTESASKQGTGTVAFEEVSESGEQSAFDSQRNGGRDAITPLSGSFTWQQTAFARPTPGVGFDFRLGYSSGNSFGGYKLGGNDPYAAGAIGSGWRHTFETRVLPAQTFSPLSDADTLGLMNWNGSIETWDLDYGTGQYETRNKEYSGELMITTTNCQWTTPERLVYFFRRPDSGPAVMRGRLISIRDFNTNTVQILWNETSGVITQVVDSVSGRYSFNYNANLLTNITFGQWQVNLGYDATNRLTSKAITNTSGLYANVNTTWQFRYDTNGLLSQIIDPRSNTNIFIQYDQYGRQTNQTDALGRSTVTRYGSPGMRQITRIDPGTNSWIETYDRKGHILAQQDPLTNITSYTYEEHGNRTSIVEPLGWTTYFGYDDRANLVAKTNALSEVTLWKIHEFFNKAVQQVTPQPPDANGRTTWTNFYQYDVHGNLTNQYDALGSLVTYTYFTNGLLFTSADANGNTTQFGYDTNGFLKTRTDAATNTATFFPNEVGWKTREVNALGEPTSYAYDLNGNVIRTQDALSRAFYRTNDPNGNVLASMDGKGRLTTYLYDAANERTNMTDRTGTNRSAYVYTSRGKLDHVTDPLNYSVTNTYDAANRLVYVSDPVGSSVTNQYNANGNLIFFFDKLGKRWSKTYDRLNRLETEADPFGNAKRTVYDVAGRIQEIVTPNGYPSLHTYDGRGRLTKWVDPENFLWHYDYDGVGNITNITDALQGHYVMVYSNRNERILERNQDNFEWHYTYDELLRLKTQTDPNLIVRSRTYDAGGRLKIVDFSTGRQDTFDYDDNDNPRLLSRRYGGVTTATQIIYDPLDLIQEEDEPNGQTVLYGHDPVGHVTSITYPGGKTLTNFYDALGRLTNQVDWAGRKMSYMYDLADRLRSRTYPNGIVQTNTFDDAGRITGLAYSSPSINSNAINVALSYAYDRNGNRTGSGEKGTFNWPSPSLVDETSHFTASGRITNRVDALNATNNFTYQFDASGNMTNASGAGQTWKLGYDEDNRTTAINWDCGITSKIITNRYDALGRRISKAVDGVTTGYVLDLSGGMERVLCDLDGNGNPTAWYIHGPDLCYKIDTTNGFTCYHADAQANIIALTDGNTNLVAQYAYTPYGRSLGSTNSQVLSVNTYTFVGSQGVMEELPALYFMRARYYSSDAGVFLSTDSIKKIGPGWRPVAFSYSSVNPLSYTDPTGKESWISTPLAGEFLGFSKAMVFDILGTAGVVVQTDILKLPKDEVLRSTQKVFNGLNWITDKAAILLSGDSIDQESIDRGAKGARWIEEKASENYYNSQICKIPVPSPLAKYFSGSSPQSSISSIRGNPLVQNVIGQFQEGQTALGQGLQKFQATYGVSGKSSVSVNAIGYGQALNTRQQTNPSQISTGSGTTTQNIGGGAQYGVGNNQNGNQRTTSTQSNSQQTAGLNSSTSFVGQVGSFISNVVSSIGSFFSSLFGGGH